VAEAICICPFLNPSKEAWFALPDHGRWAYVQLGRTFDYAEFLKELSQEPRTLPEYLKAFSAWVRKEAERNGVHVEE